MSGAKARAVRGPGDSEPTAACTPNTQSAQFSCQCRDQTSVKLAGAMEMAHTFLVDVQADEVDQFAHGCLVPFWFSHGAEFIGLFESVDRPGRRHTPPLGNPRLQ